VFASLRVLTEQLVFEPAYYSLEELQFLLDHMGESPVVAMHGGPPHGVNPNMMKPTLAKLYELEELRDKREVPWAGFEAIKDSIVRYLNWYDRSMEIKRRGGPRHPSMFGWEDNGKGGSKAHRLAPGSDSDIVRSEINSAGENVKFAVQLKRSPDEVIQGLGDVAPWMHGDPDKPKVVDAILVDDKKGFMQCSICGFARNFNLDSHQSRNLARGHLGKHMMHAAKNIDRHRNLYRREFEK
jgi:hypothetical protein